MAIIELSNVAAEARARLIFTKAGAFAANDFAGQCVVGSLGVDTVTPKLYQCSVTNGTTTSTWITVGGQV